MKRLLVIALLATSASAHPGIGVVVDSRGNIFYTDLKQVWRIATTGAKSIAVPNVHTHELYLDGHDNLYGENLWYNGDAVKSWGHSIWRRTPEGRIETAVPAHEAFRGVDFSFVRDGQGNAYWADRDHNTILKCSSKCEPLARSNFADIRWMAVTPGGTLYLIDIVDLVRITPDGRVTTMARDLSGKREKHQVMGVWTDRLENVYVADYANRCVKRVDARGHVDVIARSSFPWAPSGGVFAPNGDLWLLEYSVLNDARVRRISHQ